MSSDQTHYQRLGISQNASTEEIKKAFYRKVREHPPEQDSEAYGKIREAYDVLSSPVARKEYDSMAQHGDKIKALEEEAAALLHHDPPDAKTAIRKLKKAVVLGPEIGLLRDMLGNAYMVEEAYEDALAQYERAVSIDPENPSYQLHKGYAHRCLDHLTDAEKIFRNVWEEDRGDYESARALANVLFDQERVHEAHDVLDAAIDDDGKVDFEDFFCYYDKLHFLLYEDDRDGLRSVLDTVKGLPKTEDDRLFAAFMLGKVGSQLYDVGGHKVADHFLKAARELDPDNEDLKTLADINTTLVQLEEQVDTVLDFDRIPGVLKQVVALGWNRVIGEIDQDAYETKITEAAQFLDETMFADPICADAKATAQRIKRRYNAVYDLNPGLYDAIIEAPSATHVSEECPHCDAFITAHKHNDRGRGHCRTCGNAVYFDGSRFERAGGGSSSSSQQHASSASTGGGGGCFVATTVYGTYEHPDVRTLRAYRDGTLRRSFVGRRFIRWYYQYGPGLAHYLEGVPRIQHGIRRALQVFVCMLRRTGH